APGVVYTTFHHPGTQANVVTTDFSDWATNCPEYKVTAVQVTPSNGPTEWQRDYAEFTERSRRIAGTEMEPAESAQRSKRGGEWPTTSPATPPRWASARRCSRPRITSTSSGIRG